MICSWKYYKFKFLVEYIILCFLAYARTLQVLSVRQYILARNSATTAVLRALVFKLGLSLRAKLTRHYENSFTVAVGLIGLFLRVKHAAFSQQFDGIKKPSKDQSNASLRNEEKSKASQSIAREATLKRQLFKS